MCLQWFAGSASSPKPPSYLLGAIIGDIVGSRFERDPRKSVEGYDLIDGACRYTDDTVLTIAVADALIHEKPFAEAIRCWSKNIRALDTAVLFRNG